MSRHARKRRSWKSYITVPKFVGISGNKFPGVRDDAPKSTSLSRIVNFPYVGTVCVVSREMDESHRFRNFFEQEAESHCFQYLNQFTCHNVGPQC